MSRVPASDPVMLTTTQMKRAAVASVHRAFQFPILESTLARLTQGHEISDLVAKLAPGNERYPRPSIRYVTRGALNYRLDISDYQDWLVYWGVRTNRPVELYSLAAPDFVAFDVGANLGEVSLTLASLVGPGGRVFAFEPDPQSLEKLKRNIALNSLTNIVTCGHALGAETSTLLMQVTCAGNRGGNSVVTEAHQGETFPVRVDTLDHVVEEQQLTRLDLVKIDVEGFERSVLAGARGAIARFRPLLFVEVCDAHLVAHGTSAGDLIRDLQGLGYGVFHAVTGRELDDRADLRGLFDVIARPRER